MGIWALVREDGAASMGFCPDAASKQFGMSWTTGDIGIGLYHYLCGSASYVLTSRNAGLQTFGCHFESTEEGENEKFSIKPWDGVARRIIVRHLGLEVTAFNARIKELVFDATKRHATLELENTSDKRLAARFQLKGLWGNRFRVDQVEVSGEQGVLTAAVEIEATRAHKAQIEVIE